MRSGGHPAGGRKENPLDASATISFMPRPIAALIHPDAIAHNLRQARRQAPDARLWAVIKANAYGHGTKGFNELYKVGLLDDEPVVRVSGAQATGCSPVATAFDAGVDDVHPVRPSTIAKSLAIGNPADGYYALDVIRSTGGGCGSVSDAEIVEGIRLLARTEGVFGETAAGVTIATLKRLAEDGVIRRDERVVAYVTGHGLKTLDAIEPHVSVTTTIPPSLDAFREAFPAIAEEV